MGHGDREREDAFTGAVRIRKRVADVVFDCLPAMERMEGEKGGSPAPEPGAFKGGNPAQGELVGIGIRKGDVIAVVMAQNDIGRLRHGGEDLFPDNGTHCHLTGMGQMAVAEIAERNPRIDEDTSAAGRNHAGKTSHPERFGADDRDLHGFLSGGAGCIMLLSGKIDRWRGNTIVSGNTIARTSGACSV